MISSRLISIAPMLDWTDQYCRYFFRLFSPNTLLYTEMITTGALLHGNPERWLKFDPAEHPIAVQLGGSCQKELAGCARLAEQFGFDEVNLNVGCPSDRVQAGRFGACLMAEPDLVADCVASMQAAVNIPVTVKTRIGIDQQDSYEELTNFISKIAAAGCRVFIIHARKAWLKGLSPKENREIPPLRYDIVHQLKSDFPQLQIIINGGLTAVEQIKQQLNVVDGVMIGRVAYQNPYILAQIDQALFNSNKDEKMITRHDIIEKFGVFAEHQLSQGVPLKRMARHMLGLFHGLPCAKQWRRHLSVQMHLTSTDYSLVLAAANYVLNEVPSRIE